VNAFDRDDVPLDPLLAALLSEEDAAMLRRWCLANGRRIERAPEAVMQGHTDSSLIPAFLHQSGGPTVKALLKYSSTGAVSPSEPAGHLDAMNASPRSFARDHLVEQIGEPVLLSNGGAAMFLHIAHGSLSSITTLYGQFDSGDMNPWLREVARSVLEDWNPKPILVATRAATLLADHLAEDIRPGDTLHKWLCGHPGLREADWFSIPGVPEPLPNPLGLLDRRIAANLDIRTHVGNAHGDLHLGNVIIPRSPGADPSHYRIVDPSTFSDHAPLARDPMFLLMSAILRYLPELGRRARQAALVMLVDPADIRSAHVSDDLRRCIEGVWQAGLDWARTRSLADEWRGESLLSLTSAALRHLAWAVDPVDKWWFFRLACHATSQFLREAQPATFAATEHVVSLADIAGPDLTDPLRLSTT
jgi:hypothetical protein